MAIEVGDKIYRNLPEQVEWLSNQFVRILEAFEELGTVMRYKGSVATYADLPTENNKVGDVYNVIDTGSNYAWDGEGWDEIGSTVDLSNLVTLDTAQDITGLKTIKNKNLKFVNGSTYQIGVNTNGYFALKDSTAYDIYRIDGYSFHRYSDNIADLGLMSTYRWRNCYLGGYLQASSILVNSGLTNNQFKIKDINSYDKYAFGCGGSSDIEKSFYSYLNGDLGSSSYKWKDLYLSGNITDGTNSVAVADISNGIFNVINASDIASGGVLTDDQIAILTNGKPTLISGTYGQFVNAIVYFSYPYVSGVHLYGRTLITGKNGENPITTQCRISSAKVFAIENVSSSNGLQFNCVRTINGKIIPAYPTTNTVPQVLTIGANGGNLSWENSKPTTVSLAIDGQMSTADISAHSGKIVVLSAGEQAGGTWEVNFTLPSTIAAVGITKSGGTQIEISGTSITNHTLKITNLDELDMTAFCVIDLSDGLTAKVMAGRNF